ncbi:MAG: hypothetical protein NVS1B10_09030 [Candidatus Saccharimonadales bacterium]
MNTPEGHKKVIETLLAKDPDYFKKLGAKNKGVKKTKPSGFAARDKEELRALSRAAAMKRWHKEDL